MTATPNPADRGKGFVVFLTVATTVLAAVVAGLQADANIRANQANRESQYYAVLLAGELQRQGLQSNYDLALFATALKDIQESTVLQLTALQMDSEGKKAAAAQTRVQADAAASRAEQEKAASIFYTDPRYAPASPDGVPDLQRYVADSAAAANDLLAKQNSTADAYRAWNTKADGYVAVLTVLTIALFLLALAQAISLRLRLIFGGLGAAAALAAGVWAAYFFVAG